MVKCWNCEHLIRIYSGKPTNEKMLEKELRKRKAKGIIFERYNVYTKERDCEDYEESKHKIKYQEIVKTRKGRPDVS